MGTRDELRQLADFLALTDTTPVIDHTLPMEQARDGIEAIAKGDVFGKIVLTR
jgi:D-arabinose 1-dehydrogenase-like Zn-dependent alcohol dehydrogenase